MSLRFMHRNRPALFKGRHFEAEIIVLCVCWYLRFGLSFRNLEEHGRAEPPRRARHDLALGAALRAGTPPALPPGTADDQSVVALGRNLPPGRRQVDLFC